MNRPPLSAVVTCFDNAATLAACLASLAFCEDLVVLDSGSSDASRDIAAAHGARVFVEPFKGYGPQKQSAVDKAAHDWVLLLDADEEMTPDGRARIEAELAAPRAEGYRLARREWLFWRWPHRWTRPTWQLRLFRRSRGALNEVPVHAAPQVRGRVRDLFAEFLHHGEADLAVRVDKVNRYSSGLVAHKSRRRQPLIWLFLVLYPGWVFLRMYLGKRYLFSGAAGFLAARTQAFYAFLRYAKVYEARRKAR